MKRLLALLGLMAVLLLPQAAQAAPFCFGQNSGAGMSFNDKQDVPTNLNYLKMLDGSASFASAPASSLDLSKKWQFTGIGFSQYAFDQGFSSIVGRKGESGSADDGMRFQDEYLASQINMSWFVDDRHDEFSMTLEELIRTCVTTVYVLQSDISFQLDEDLEAFTFKAGTIFFGIKLPGGSTNSVDFLMAAGPLAPVVPVPAAVWLMGTGVAGVAALRRKMK